MNKAVRATTISLVLIALTSLCNPAAKAQLITGKWYGTSDITRAPGYHLSSTEEKGDILQLSRADANSLSGISYHYYWFRGNFYYYVKNLEYTYDTKTSEWVIKETGVKDNHLFRAHYPCLRTYRLKFITNKQKDSLTGSWTAASFEDCGAGTGSFARTKPASKEKGHPDSIAAMLVAVPVSSNKNEVGKDLPQVVSKEKVKQEAALQQMLARRRTQVQEINLQTPDIKVEIWDNNMVDGDNISLYFNKELIVNRKRLTADPITVHIKAIPGKDNELIMYANNLGEIPPNTSMMRIYADGKQYDIFMSSDEHTNGMVKFVLQ
jgi:hypothetical protein